MNRTSFLQSKNINLVCLTEADAAVAHHWFNNHSITRFLARGAWPMTEAKAAQYYKSMQDSQNHLVLGIWHIATKKMIGTTGLHDIDPVNQTAELGIVIGDHTFHEHGIGTEVVTTLCTHAFSWLNLRNVTLRVLGNNPRAIRCYQKCGFYQTGRLPGHIFKDGIWVDEIHMLLPRENFGLTTSEETNRRIAYMVQQSIPESMK